MDLTPTHACLLTYGTRHRADPPTTTRQGVVERRAALVQQPAESEGRRADSFGERDSPAECANGSLSFVGISFMLHFERRGQPGMHDTRRWPTPTGTIPAWRACVRKRALARPARSTKQIVRRRLNQTLSGRTQMMYKLPTNPAGVSRW